MSHMLNYTSADGAKGYIFDITQAPFYKEPPIELYDGLEQSCYELVCDFAELIGVHLDKAEADYSMANQVRDSIVKLLEEQFKIPFPVYGENAEERAERIGRAKERFKEYEVEFAEDVPLLVEQIKSANEQKEGSRKSDGVEINCEHPLGGLYL